MKINFTLCAAVVCLGGLVSPISASDKLTSSIDIYLEPDIIYNQEETYQVWTGSGWYYGIWFDDEDEYYDWVENHFYDPVWSGSGWYYGIWFDDEDNFDYFRQGHRFYGRSKRHGDRNQHSHEQRGKWRGDSRSGQTQEGQAIQRKRQRDQSGAQPRQNEMNKDSQRQNQIQKQSRQTKEGKAGHQRGQNKSKERSK